jgi:hypothetical protein
LIKEIEETTDENGIRHGYGNYIGEYKVILENMEWYDGGYYKACDLIAEEAAKHK